MQHYNPEQAAKEMIESIAAITAQQEKEDALELEAFKTNIKKYFSGINENTEISKEEYQKFLENPERLKEDRDTLLTALNFFFKKVNDLEQTAAIEEINTEINYLRAAAIHSKKEELPPCPKTNKKCLCWEGSTSRAHCATSNKKESDGTF